MAIDSAEKRLAASGHWHYWPVVTPDSGKDAMWRQQAAGTYSGIAAGGGSSSSAADTVLSQGATVIGPVLTTRE